eukprot:TRINITY_DN6347_c0_g1_i1.p1 TRINITY_DN6347_c0_g1~~TRINITY_DN6347_c0_g1_i1.p1  ORF type:complete len:462 (+),score=74.99 TRINITY_DN6347_c0_g1_i1:134-1519(+)
MENQRNQTEPSNEDKKPKIIFYKQQNSDLQQQTEKYRGEYYPPPSYLHPELSDKIKKILGKEQKNNDLEQLAAKLESQSKEKNYITKDRYQAPFVNPRLVDLLCKKNLSKLQLSFLQNYQNYCIQGLNDRNVPNQDQKVVDTVLFSELSSSSLASHKWGSVKAKQHLIGLSTICPNLDNYPITPRLQQELTYINQKKTSSQIRRQNAKKGDQDSRKADHLEDVIVLDTTMKLGNFLKKMQLVENRKKKVYQDKYDDMEEILDYQKSLVQNKSDLAHYPIDQAYSDVQYIKSKKKQYEIELTTENYNRFMKMQKQENELAQDNDQIQNAERMPFFKKSLRKLYEQEKLRKTQKIQNLQQSRSNSKLQANNKNTRQVRLNTVDSPLLPGDQLKKRQVNGLYLDYLEKDIFVRTPANVPRSKLLIEQNNQQSTTKSNPIVNTSLMRLRMKKIKQNIQKQNWQNV